MREACRIFGRNKKYITIFSRETHDNTENFLIIILKCISNE
jgi:hypothetical protein